MDAVALLENDTLIDVILNNWDNTDKDDETNDATVAEEIPEIPVVKALEAANMLYELEKFFISEGVSKEAEQTSESFKKVKEMVKERQRQTTFYEFLK